MRIILLTVITLLFGKLAIAQGDRNYNFSFERIAANKPLPDGWIQWGSGYQLKLDSLTKSQGKVSILIEPLGEKAPNTFGSIAYAIPCQYEGKELEVRAQMKLNGVSDGFSGLLLRVDGVSGTLGFDNMQKENIQGTKDWAIYSVRIPYPAGAKTMYVGALLTGKGQLWVDDFQVLLDGKDIREAQIVTQKELKADRDKEFDSGSGISTITLSDFKTNDLVVLGKVWGFLKYYHPQVAAGECNWDYELFRIAPKVIQAKDAADRNRILSLWVASFGNVEPNRESSSTAEIKMNPDLSWITESNLGTDLATSLNLVRESKRSGNHYYIGWLPNVSNPEFRNERPYVSLGYPDPGYRLLSLFRYWNMIHYFFPYKNLIEEDWNNVLKEFIPKFNSASNELEYKLTALSLIARIHDTHANIYGNDNTLNGYKGRRWSPLEVTFIEDKAVVTDYYDKTYGERTGIKIGDVIESVNGKAVMDMVEDRLAFTPASNYPTQLRDIGRSLLRTNDGVLNLRYFNGTVSKEARIDTYASEEMNVYAKFQRKDTCFKMIEPGIAYLFPGTIKNAYLPKIMPEVMKAKGLVIDFRCYPSDFIVFSLSEYLLPEAKSFVKFSKGSTIMPGQFVFTSEIKVGKSNPDYFKGKVVILINETTQSSAEYHTMAFRTAPKATVVGSTTAGADGNVSRIVLPGGINTMISGIGVYYPDGRETQRVGIIPDIEEKPTIIGVKKGRDELLERAIQLIKEK